MLRWRSCGRRGWNLRLERGMVVENGLVSLRLLLTGRTWDSWEVRRRGVDFEAW